MAGEWPECEKLAAVAEQRDAIVQFLEWASYQRGARLCMVPQGSSRWESLPDHAEALAHEFLGIDGVKLEAERRAMVEAMHG